MNSYLIKENQFPKNEAHHETLFSQGNGFVGIRGSFYETISLTEGCFVNTFYETHTIKYGEKSYGFPEITESMVNIPSPRHMAFKINGEVLAFTEAFIEDYKRVLDLRTGLLTMDYTIHHKGLKCQVHSESFVSFIKKETMMLKYQVTPLNFDGEITLISRMNKASRALVAKDDPRVADIEKPAFYIKDEVIENDFYGYVFETFETKMRLGVYEGLDVVLGDLVDGKVYVDDGIFHELTFKGIQNEPIQVIKHNEIHLEPKDFKFLKKDFEALLNEQKEYLKDFWRSVDLELYDNEDLTQGIRFNLFHLLQSVNKTGDFGIAAKGLTGEGYEGHNFWDTEIFIFPFFLFTQPEIAKHLLIYRYHTLDEAKKRARVLGYEKGAKFPWRSITGIECSGYFPAGTAQYHINADIAYAVNQYYEVTGDEAFMKDYGLEILLETARFFMAVGYFTEEGFKIHGVTGPDEYTTLVNNNYYTNKMVKENLKNAYKYLNQIENALAVDPKELKEFKKAYENMYLPFDEKRNLIPQDDSFLSKEPWDFDQTPQDHYPLLLHYHPMKIYKHQVLKQADVCLADFLLGDDVPIEIKKNNYDYYFPLTTHDSSLSYNTYSIMACELGYLEQAYDLYTKNVRLDIDNSHNNSNHGIHTAAMGGSWLGLVFGFAGMRLTHEGLKFSPKTTPSLGAYTFMITYKGSKIKVSVNGEGVTYTLVSGDGAQFYNNVTKVELSKKSPEIMI